MTETAVDAPVQQATAMSEMDRMYGAAPDPVITTPVVLSESTPPPTPEPARQDATQPVVTSQEPAAETSQKETTTTAEAAPPPIETTDDDLIKEMFGGLTSDTPESATPAPAPVDFSAYKDILGKEVKTQDEFITEIKALKEAQKQYSEVFNGVDEGLKNLVDIARMGGDWREIQNYVTFDFNSIPAVEYYKDDLITSGLFPNTPEGLAERDEWLEAQDQRLINALSQPLKNAAVAKQKDFIYKQQQQLVAEKSAKDERLKQTLYGEKSIKSIGGVDITPAKRDNYYQRIASGQVLYKGKDGKPDFDATVKMIHLYENIADISKTLIARAKTASTKSVLLEASNANVTRNTPSTPLVEASKPKTLMEEYFGG